LTSRQEALCLGVVHLSVHVYVCKKGKGSPYSIAKHRVLKLILVIGSQPAGDVSHKPGCRLAGFPPGLQLPSQPFRGLPPVSLLGEHRHDGCEQFALPDTS